jgi:hypothetical protein
VHHAGTTSAFGGDMMLSQSYYITTCDKLQFKVVIDSCHSNQANCHHLMSWPDRPIIFCPSAACCVQPGFLLAGIHCHSAVAAPRNHEQPATKRPSRQDSWTRHHPLMTCVRIPYHLDCGVKLANRMSIQINSTAWQSGPKPVSRSSSRLKPACPHR